MDERPRPRSSLLARTVSLGSAAQAVVPGIYAWAVTVAPAALQRSATWFAKATALLGLVVLLAGVALEARIGARARYVSVWGLVVTSVLVWITTPSSLGPLRLDEPRGVAGMLGWALFAFASAAPALRRDTDRGSRVIEDDPLPPRTRLRRGDMIYIVGGVVLAVGLQGIGWRVTVPERALLVRVVTLAAGLSLIGAATSVALARHGRPAGTQRGRLRAGLAWVVLLILLAIAGAVTLLRR
jgi:hypothetical protein